MRKKPEYTLNQRLNAKLGGSGVMPPMRDSFPIFCRYSSPVKQKIFPGNNPLCFKIMCSAPWKHSQWNGHGSTRREEIRVGQKSQNFHPGDRSLCPIRYVMFISYLRPNNVVFSDLRKSLSGLNMTVATITWCKHERDSQWKYTRWKVMVSTTKFMQSVTKKMKILWHKSKDYMLWLSHTLLWDCVGPF